MLVGTGSRLPTMTSLFAMSCSLSVPSPTPSLPLPHICLSQYCETKSDMRPEHPSLYGYFLGMASSGIFWHASLIKHNFCWPLINWDMWVLSDTLCDIKNSPTNLLPVSIYMEYPLLPFYPKMMSVFDDEMCFLNASEGWLLFPSQIC